MDRYSIVVAHGESHSLFYVVDNTVDEGEHPNVIQTYYNREDAEACVELIAKCNVLVEDSTAGGDLDPLTPRNRG